MTLCPSQYFTLGGTQGQLVPSLVMLTVVRVVSTRFLHCGVTISLCNYYNLGAGTWILCKCPVSSKTRTQQLCININYYFWNMNYFDDSCKMA